MTGTLAKTIICFLIAIVIGTGTVSAIAQNDPRRDNDRIVIPQGETEILYHKPEDVPRQLRAAAGTTCDYKDRLDQFPIRIVRLNRPNMKQVALVHCGSVILHSIAFTIGRMWEPEPIDFPIRSSPNGFEVTRKPGYLEWHADTQTLTATQFTDVVPSYEWRHIYRVIDRDFPFGLTEIEYRSKRYPIQPWASYWKSPDWADPK